MKVMMFILIILIMLQMNRCYYSNININIDNNFYDFYLHRVSSSVINSSLAGISTSQSMVSYRNNKSVSINTSRSISFVTLSMNSMSWAFTFTIEKEEGLVSVVMLLSLLLLLLLLLLEVSSFNWS